MRLIKRSAALLMVCALILFSLLAAAEEAGVRVDYGEQFFLYRPSALELIELTEEDVAEGLVDAASSDELEMYVYAYDMEGLSADELFEELREDDTISDIEEKTSGEMRFLLYTIDEETVGLTIPCDDGKEYEFIFYYMSDGALELAQKVIDSIAPIE